MRDLFRGMIDLANAAVVLGIVCTNLGVSPVNKAYAVFWAWSCTGPIKACPAKFAGKTLAAGLPAPVCTKTAGGAFRTACTGSCGYCTSSKIKCSGADPLGAPCSGVTGC